MSTEDTFIILSPCYEPVRYGYDLIAKRTKDAHIVGKFTKFVFGINDLIDPYKPPTPDNYKFDSRQVLDADVAVFVERKLIPAVQKDSDLWGRRKKRSHDRGNKKKNSIIYEIEVG